MRGLHQLGHSREMQADHWGIIQGLEEAMRRGESVPVDRVELTPEEERLALAVLDPITEMTVESQQPS